MVTRYFLRVRSNVYSQLGSVVVSQPVDWQNISLTLKDSVSGSWLHPPGNHPVVDLYSLSFTLPI